MIKRIIVASALAVLSVGSAGAQSLETRQSPAVFSTAGNSAVQNCEMQMRRMAGLNKTLAANYNAERVQDECVASPEEKTTRPGQDG